MAEPPQDPRRLVPSVDRLLGESAVSRLIEVYGRDLVRVHAQRQLAALRAEVAAAGGGAESLEALGARLEAALRAESGGLRRVLNATGVWIHTNLGRAPLPRGVIARLGPLLDAGCDLELDLESGRRGRRQRAVEPLLRAATGAEAALAVNNNAAALLLAFAALGRGRQAIVSRGELVEIGGAFRMPDVMASAGAHLVEVGTTNRTHARDYEQAINERTALLMKVHTSNYAVQGFTAAVGEAELCAIAQARGLPVATDLGSGALVDLAAWGLPHEPMPQEMLASGCDVVTFSGDKLLGGPQAGLLVGSRDIIGRIRCFPMKRALRMSKLPLAALEATLRLYLRPERLTQDLPTLRLLTRPADQIRALAAQLQPAMAQAVAPRFAVAVAVLMGQIGSGSLPVERLPSAGLAITSTAGKRGSGRALDELATALRRLPRPVIGRIAEDRLLLDLRVLEVPAQLTDQLPALQAALA
jgi:L-seryl-tRNA(Ser) seleniumtransferase